jgi:hypothetical protein
MSADTGMSLSRPDHVSTTTSQQGDKAYKTNSVTSLTCWPGPSPDRGRQQRKRVSSSPWPKLDPGHITGAESDTYLPTTPGHVRSLTRATGTDYTVTGPLNGTTPEPGHGRRAGGDGQTGDKNGNYGSLTADSVSPPTTRPRPPSLFPPRSTLLRHEDGDTFQTTTHLHSLGNEIPLTIPTPIGTSNSGHGPLRFPRIRSVTSGGSGTLTSIPTRPDHGRPDHRT